MSSLRSDSNIFSTHCSQQALQQQAHAQQHAEAAAEAEAAVLMQQLRDNWRSLCQQQAAAKELKQQVLDSHAVVVNVQQLIAAESAASIALMTQLQAAESEGGTAKQLAQPQQELAGREVGLVQQKFRCASVWGSGWGCCFPARVMGHVWYCTIALIKCPAPPFNQPGTPSYMHQLLVRICLYAPMSVCLPN